MGKYSLEVKRKDIVSEEDAVTQFMSFLNFYKLDLDESAKQINEQQKKESTNSDEIGDVYVKSIRQGYYEITTNSNGNVEITQYLENKINEIETITYGVIKGKNRVQAGTTQSSDGETRTVALLNSLSNTAGNIVEKLRGNDYTKACEIGSLYFLV